MIRLVVAVVVLIGCGKSSQDRTEARSSQVGSNSRIDVAGSNSQQQSVVRIAAFWKWFAEHAPALKAEPDLQKVMETVSNETEKIDPGLIGEIAVDGDKRQLVLSADGNRELFPLVQATYAARPAQLEGWSVVAFRPRAKANDGMTIELAGNKITPRDVKFVATPTEHKLDVVVFIPGFTTVDEMGSLGFVLLDHAVGEYDMETKIAGVDFAGLDKAPASAKPLTELPAQVDALR